MSHLIENNDITLTRGDTLILNLNLTKNGEPFTPEEGSTIRFAMKRKYTDPDEDALVIDIPIDALILEIEPEDTKHLAQKKTYVYDIQLTEPDGRVDTFISGKFRISEEVL